MIILILTLKLILTLLPIITTDIINTSTHTITNTDIVITDTNTITKLI